MEHTLTIKFETEVELARYMQSRKCADIVSELAKELRACVKYGEPTQRDEYWRTRLYELAQDVGVDPMDV